MNNYMELIGIKAKKSCENRLNTKKKNLSICGWVSKKDFKKRASFYPKGTVRMRGPESFPLRADNWEIENKDLNEFS